MIGPALSRMGCGCESGTVSSVLLGCCGLVVLATVVNGSCSAVSASEPAIGSCSAVSGSALVIGCADALEFVNASTSDGTTVTAVTT